MLIQQLDIRGSGGLVIGANRGETHARENECNTTGKKVIQKSTRFLSPSGFARITSGGGNRLSMNPSRVATAPGRARTLHRVGPGMNLSRDGRWDGIFIGRSGRTGRAAAAEPPSNGSFPFPVPDVVCGDDGSVFSG